MDISTTKISANEMSFQPSKSTNEMSCFALITHGVPRCPKQEGVWRGWKSPAHLASPSQHHGTATIKIRKTSKHGTMATPNFSFKRQRIVEQSKEIHCSSTTSSSGTSNTGSVCATCNSLKCICSNTAYCSQDTHSIAQSFTAQVEEAKPSDSATKPNHPGVNACKATSFEEKEAPQSDNSDCCSAIPEVAEDAEGPYSDIDTSDPLGVGSNSPLYTMEMPAGNHVLRDPKGYRCPRGWEEINTRFLIQRLLGRGSYG